ncbi:MAG TPA: HAD family hydrolase [Acidimicrobiales bacterium]|nr:HAD family hydrolase [Acidimicrobiales bacterium]
MSAARSDPVIPAVLIDVGGVLCTPEHTFARQALAMVGVEAHVDDLDRAHYAGIAALDAGFLETGILDWGRYNAAVARTVGVPDELVPAAVVELDRAWRGTGRWERIVPGALDGLRQLADTGVPLGVVSNANGTVAEQLMTAKVLQVGEGHGVPVLVVVDSTVVGVEKPDPRIFGFALEAIGVDDHTLAHILYVGDTIFADVRGAQAAGLRPMHLDPYGDCPAPGDHEHVGSLADVAALVRASRPGAAE